MTSDLLSQDEIDALLNGVDSGAIETEEPPPVSCSRSVPCWIGGKMRSPC